MLLGRFNAVGVLLAPLKMADFLLSFIRLLHSHVIFCSSQQTVTMFLRYFWINFFLSQEFEQILRPIIILLISILNISRLRSRLDRFFDTSNPFMTSEKEHFFFLIPQISINLFFSHFETIQQFPDYYFPSSQDADERGIRVGHSASPKVNAR